MTKCHKKCDEAREARTKKVNCKSDRSETMGQNHKRNKTILRETLQTREKMCTNGVPKKKKSPELPTQLFHAPCNDISANWICTMGNM